MRRVLLIGATGFFGRRLARHLSSIDGVALLVTSRSEARAASLAKSINSEVPSATVTAHTFDRETQNLRDRLAALDPWLVIDASGPFQTASYDLARAATAAGAHWIDLADARGYLVGFENAIDEDARAQGVAAIAGASSTPALSTAAVTELTRGWRRIDTVDISICPGGGGKVGVSVIRAVLQYAGTPIGIFSDGKAGTTIGWGNDKTLDVPGIGTRRVAPVETADDVLLRNTFAVTSRIAFHAGLESPIEHFGLLALARLRSAGLVRDLAPLAPWLERARAVTRLFASDRGGMTVDCTGIDGTGRAVRARWWLLAEHGDGPHVPVLPAVALTRQLLADAGSPGAATAAGKLTLSQIECEMRPLALTTGRTFDRGSEMSAPVKRTATNASATSTG